MGHITAKSYTKLQKRLDSVAQGAPESDSLYKILEILFTKKEAELASVLPVNFFTITTAAKIWKKSPKTASKILNELADKGLLFDFKKGKTRAFILAPTMAGFIEFAIMRIDNRFDKKLLSELFSQYINKEDAFTKRIFLLNPAIDRVYVQEDTIQEEDKTEVLDYERATHVIDKASCITVSNCYCRHKMEHLGKACDMPQKVCLTFNQPAKSLAKHGIAKEINKKEEHKILDKCIKLGLVQLGDNIQDDVGWICNCCSCCCEGLGAYKRLGYRSKINSNFVSKHSDKECVGCGICMKRCPVDAIKLYKTKSGKKYAKVHREKCIGCGVCTRFCPTKSRVMKKRSKRKFVPKDTFERYILNAIETGTLHNYIFDNQSLWTHNMLRRFLGVILNLKPAKQLLASKQIQSRFMNVLIKTNRYDLFDELCNEKGKKLDYSHPEMKE